MRKLLYSVVLLSFFLTACDDIFVKDISKKNIEIVAPGDGIVLTSNTLSLVWETMEGAEEYHVIVVSPSFENIENYVCDSITEDYKMKLTLDAGVYEWSVQGCNIEYVSQKSFRTFEIAEP